MKENLVQQLDLLEAQLARAEAGREELRSGRLARTKHLLERLEKSGALSADAAQLRSEIARVKHELVKRKVFYAQSAVKRFVKQFNKLEPLRLAKRMKAVGAASSDPSSKTNAEPGAESGAEASTKASTEASTEANAEATRQKKRAQLEAEADLVARADAEEWARELVLRGLAKTFDIETVTGEPFVKRPLAPAEMNVFARLGKSDAVKGAVAQLVASVGVYFAPRADSAAASGAASNAAKSTAKKNTATSTATNNPANAASSAASNATSAAAGEPDDFTRFASDEDDDDDDDDDDAEDAPARSETAADPFFTGAAVSMDISDSENEDDESARGGLPLLAQGYISGSDDEDDAGDVAAAAAAPERRNRRGQRARRKIWEQKFGRRANHILKQEREEQRLREEKESRKRRREEREMQARRQKQEFAAKPVHPSWQARLAQKQKQEQVRFEGKKRKFE